VNEDVVIGC